MKVGRITNDGTLMIKGEIVETTSSVNIIEGFIPSKWSGGYSTNPETPNIYYVAGKSAGFSFPKALFEDMETYILSFKIRKTSGDILSIGGHSAVFQDMEVYLDNRLIGNNWSAYLQNTYPNDNLEHNYKVVLTFRNIAGDGNLYFQPNRNNGYATDYTAEVYDLKLEKKDMSISDFSLNNQGDLQLDGELIERIIQPPLLYFNGVSQAVTIANTDNRLQPSDQFTWEMWFKLDGYTQYNTLMGFSSNDLDFARMDALTGFQCHTWDINGNQTFVTPSGFPSVNDGQWHHMAIVWDGVNGKRWGFIDGVQRYYATMGVGASIMSTSPFASFTIGGTSGTGRLIKGWIKEVRMWQVARTQEEIISTMNTKLTGNEDGLFMYLPLDEGKGNLVIDKASGFETNINGAEWQVDSDKLKFKDGALYVEELIEDENFFTPTSLHNLQLWLDASEKSSLITDSDGRVSQWEDLSANGHKGIQGTLTQQPIYQESYVTFDGIDDLIDFHSSILNMGLNDMSIYTVLSTTETSTSTQYYFSKAKAAAQQYRYAVRTRAGNNGAFMQGDGGTDIAPNGNRQIADGKPHLLLTQFERNSNISLFVDGEFDGGTQISHWANANMQSNNPARLGSYTASNNIGPTGPFNGNIMEIIIYNRILNESERQQMEQYLMTKWGIS